MYSCIRPRLLTAVGMKGVAVVLNWCLFPLLGCEAGAVGPGTRGLGIGAPTGSMASRCLPGCTVPPTGLAVGRWEGGGSGG